MNDPNTAFLDSRIENRLAAIIASLQQGGGGTGGPSIEARVARMESDVAGIRENIGEIKGDVREIKRDARTDFRLYFAALITVAIGLAGLMAKGFHWIGG